MTVGERMKARRKEIGMSAEQVAEQINVSPATIYRYENGAIEKMGIDKLAPIAKAIKTTAAYLMGWEEPLIDTEETVKVRYIGDVAAGFNHLAVDEYETMEVPKSWLRGRPASAYFAMRVSGNSMYPDYKDGDEVLCLATNEMGGSGKVGVIIYNSEQATLKRLVYKKGEDWLDLVPVNPMVPTERIEGYELELCKVIGKPLRLIRNVEEG